MQAIYWEWCLPDASSRTAPGSVPQNVPTLWQHKPRASIPPLRVFQRHSGRLQPLLPHVCTRRSPTAGSVAPGNDGHERCPHAEVAGLLVLREGRSPPEHPTRLTAPWAAQQGAGLTVISLLQHRAGSQRTALRGKIISDDNNDENNDDLPRDDAFCTG